MLPFLDDKKWPVSREDENRVANPSYDTQIQDSLVDEMLMAIEKKDVKALRESMQALIEHLRTEQNEM